MTAQTDQPVPAVVSSADSRSGKYLTFRLGGEEFGIRIRHVREIIGMQNITAVPGTPAHLKGVINLRGKIIPVVDLRTRFRFPESSFTATTCIIVAQVSQAGEQTMGGLVVDSVCEVVNIGGNDIEDAPDFGEGVETPFILGIAKFKGSVKILLRIEDVLALRDLRGVDMLV
jgi:purine-binding chemotaxis protein CheW